ncbi:hypothetical protein RUM43_007181 [Polyplax serrata]|uniref:Peptidase S1 domain-containing protein n=1 Tax=Polyplax serrata TaxID=468196 RepID=A0AAN8SA49_POLSC
MIFNRIFLVIIATHILVTCCTAGWKSSEEDSVEASTDSNKKINETVDHKISHEKKGENVNDEDSDETNNGASKDKSTKDDDRMSNRARSSQEFYFSNTPNTNNRKINSERGKKNCSTPGCMSYFDLIPRKPEPDQIFFGATYSPGSNHNEKQQSSNRTNDTSYDSNSKTEVPIRQDIVFPHNSGESPFDKTTENSQRNFQEYMENNDSRSEGNVSENVTSNSLSVESCGLQVPRRIIGGTTTDIDEFPWLALLQYSYPNGKISHECGGVLISKRYVLTAAHCTNGTSLISRNIQLRKIKLGEWDLSTDKDCQGEICSAPVQEIFIEKIICHERYRPRDKAQNNDISLVKLKEEAKINRKKQNMCIFNYDGIVRCVPEFVQPICLPLNEMSNDNYEVKKLTVSGWGRTSNARDSSSSIKKKVDLPVVDWERCRQFYESFYGGLKITRNQFCAGGESGEDSCQGDSGGPLMTTEMRDNHISWVLIGLVSSGPAACGVENRPSLYTNVSRYVNWIMQNIQK